MCSEWFELVEKAKLSNEQTEQLIVAAQAQFKVMKPGAFDHGQLFGLGIIH